MSIFQSLARILRSGAPAPALRVDDAGVRRRFPDGREESVSWSDLQSVEIRTTSEGPFAEDVFFFLVERDGRSCEVPQGEAMETDLVMRLQELPGFDSEAVIAAMGSTDDARFHCWRRADGAAAASRG